MYIDPSVKQQAEARLGHPLPHPSSDAYDDLILELEQDDPELAALLQNSLIFEGVGDPREAARREEARGRLKRDLRNTFFMRSDELTGEAVTSKTKVTLFATGLLVFMGYGGYWLNQPNVVAQAVSGTPASVAVEAEEETTSTSIQEDGFSGMMNDIQLALLPTLEPSPPVPEPTPALPPPPVSAPSVATQPLAPPPAAANASLSGAHVSLPEEPAASAVVAVHEAAPSTSAVVSVAPPSTAFVRVSMSPQNTHVLSSRTAASGNSSVVTSNGRQSGSHVISNRNGGNSSSHSISPSTTNNSTYVIGGNRTNGSNVVARGGTPSSTGDIAERGATQTGGVQRQAQPSSPPAPISGTTASSAGFTDPLTQTLAEVPVPFYESTQPEVAAAPPAETSATIDSRPYAIGATLTGTLATGLLTADGSALPAIVETSDGAIWRGQATINRLSRVEIVLEQVSRNGQVYPVHAVVVDTDDYPGVPARISEQAPTLAADLMATALRGVTDYVTQLGNSPTITQRDDTTVIEQQAVPLEWAVAGSVAQLFSPPQTQRSMVRVAEVAKGTPLSVIVME